MKIPLVIPYISVNVYVYVYNKNQGNIPKCLSKISTSTVSWYLIKNLVLSLQNVSMAFKIQLDVCAYLYWHIWEQGDINIKQDTVGTIQTEISRSLPRH